MKRESLDLSGKIDGFTVELFRTLADTAEPNRISFFVVGATARDIILEHAYGIQTIRATNDIHLGVEVSGWEQYRRLRESLMATGRFEPAKGPQELRYQGSVSVDLIPFGDIASPGGAFSWPPDHEVEMDTLGFAESHRHSLNVKLAEDPDLFISFANQAGLALMKLISWHHRYPERKKDAKDLGLLMRSHIDTGNEDRLFAEEADLIRILAESGGFDYRRAGARLLGRDISAMANPETRERLVKILERETGERDRYRLAEDMMDLNVKAGSDFEENLILIEELKAGFMEGPNFSQEP